LLNKEHPSTIVCPITTNVKPDSEILRVHLRKSKFGLKEDCDIKRLVKKVGIVDSDTADKIRENLKIVLDLD